MTDYTEILYKCIHYHYCLDIQVKNFGSSNEMNTTDILCPILAVLPVRQPEAGRTCRAEKRTMQRAWPATWVVGKLVAAEEGLGGGWWININDPSSRHRFSFACLVPGRRGSRPTKVTQVSSSTAALSTSSWGPQDVPRPLLPDRI